MDHMKVLKRAWHILWQYKTLWVFGIILALTTATASSSGSASPGSGSSNNNNQNPPEEFQPFDGGEFSFQENFEEEMEEFGRVTVETIEEYKGVIITVAVMAACFLFLLMIAGTVLRYVSEVALIRMVDDYEETEVKRTFREGWRMGWSLAAWRLFLIDLLLFVVLFPAFVLLGFLVALPAIITLAIGGGLAVFGVVVTVGLAFLLILFGIVIAVAMAMLIEFFRRTCVLEGLTVIESLRRGFAFVRQNLKDIGLMWLIVLGIKLVTPLAMFPIVVAAGGLGLVMSGFLGLVAGGLTGLFVGPGAAIIVAIFVGLPVFILLVAIPVTFVKGLKETYLSTSWTLTYREINALGELENGNALPEPDEPALQPA
ncbi:MAG: hypothetical protein JXB38_19335 [Anaerolineales bacterium]|nr:hypothetical protein [Anaerolineales bacterium]